jgi:NAD(P) transhydrogenase subunit alpha
MSSDSNALKDKAEALAEAARNLADKAEQFAGGMAGEASQTASTAMEVAQKAGADAAAAGGGSGVVIGLTVLVLAIFVGYHVVWSVTPALHSPLMAVTNAVSSVIIVGALIAAGPAEVSFSQAMGLIAVALAAVNIFGGFIVTQRMLGMFHKKK